jgi:hypothetical protein
MSVMVAPIGRFASVRLAKELAELGLHLRERRRGDLHRPVGATTSDAIAVVPILFVRLGVVEAAVGAAALGALEREARDGLRNDEQVAQLEHEIPARVEDPAARNPERRPASTQPPELRDRLLQVALHAKDPDEPLHHVLEVSLEPIGALAVLALERRGELADALAHLDRIDVRLGRVARGVGRGTGARPRPEHEQIGQRVSAEPVRAVHAARNLARGEQSRHG